MNEQEIRQTIREFITCELIRDESYPLKDDEGIISNGLMDSFSLAELGVFVEDRYNIYIPDADLTVDQMDTLDLIVARIMRG